MGYTLKSIGAANDGITDPFADDGTDGTDGTDDGTDIGATGTAGKRKRKPRTGNAETSEVPSLSVKRKKRGTAIDPALVTVLLGAITRTLAKIRGPHWECSSGDLMGIAEPLVDLLESLPAKHSKRIQRAVTPVTLSLAVVSTLSGPLSTEIEMFRIGREAKKHGMTPEQYYDAISRQNNAVGTIPDSQQTSGEPIQYNDNEFGPIRGKNLFGTNT